MEQNGLPPSGNTGAQNTYREGLRALVDWVSATFKRDVTLENVFDFLGLSRDLFVDRPTGRHGYKRMMSFGHIDVLYDGNVGMGFHIEMSGQGCREYEVLRPDAWFELFHYVLQHGNFTRLDVAIDDFAGYLKVGQLIRKIKQGQCRSKFKAAKEVRSYWIDDGADLGRTAYFGSPKSRIKVRFYDKAAERLSAGKDLEEGLQHWVRSEIECRDERADNLAAFVLAGESLGDLAAGVLRNYITFLDRPKGGDTNKARWPVAKFWTRFLGDVGKLRLTQVAPDRTVERVKRWVDHQVSPSLGLLFLANESRLDWLVDVLNDGMSRLTEKEMNMLNAYKEMIAAAKHEEDVLQNAVEKNKRSFDPQDQEPLSLTPARG